VGLVPGRDLVPPLAQRAAELVDLGRAGLVLQIALETFDELDCDRRVGVRLDLTNHLLGVPSSADLTFRVASLEQPGQSGSTVVVEAFVGHHQQFASLVERIIGASAMAVDVVLNAATDVIQFRVGELDDMERTSHQPGLTRILAWASGLPRSANACGTSSIETLPVIHGARSTRPSAIAVSASLNSPGS